MTGTVAPARPRVTSRSWVVNGGELLTARVTSAGRVVVHQVIAVAQLDAYGRSQVWPTASTERDLGQVDPDDIDAWFHAEVLLRRAGYRPVMDWTTIERLPAVRLTRTHSTSPGAVPGGN